MYLELLQAVVELSREVLAVELSRKVLACGSSRRSPELLGLAEGCDGKAIFLVVHQNLLEGEDLASHAVP